MSNATRVATYRAKQLSLRTAQAKRVEELEALLRKVAEVSFLAEDGLIDDRDVVIITVGTVRKIREALEGSAKP